MAFNQYNLERVHDQSRGGFDLFVYRNMDDTIAEITAPNYFDPDKFGFKSPGDSAKLIKVSCADGDYEVKLSGGVASVVGVDKTEPSAAGFVVSKLENNTSDACIFMCSDSTGNESDESLKLLVDRLAQKYPAFTVDYYLWDTGTDDYAAAEVVQTGTGSNTLNVYNAAINGSRPNYILGEHFDNAVKAIPKADLIIYNHGHNIGSGGTWDTSDPLDGRAQLMLSGVLSILEVHEGAGVLFSGQNPRRDDDLATLMHEAIVQSAGLINADLADSYERFEAVGRASEYYDDNIHPSPLGHEKLIFPALLEKFNSTVGKSAYCSLLEERANILVNGDFSAFSGATPDSWAAVNTVTSKDTTNFESSNGYSVKLTWNTSGGSHNINQSIDSSLLPRLRGKRVTLAARVYIPDGSPSSTPRIKIQSTGLNVTSRDDDQGQGGFVWKFISAVVPNNATFLQAILIGDGSTSNGSPSFDRVSMTIGSTGHDLPVV